MFWHRQLSITSFSNMPPRQDMFSLSQETYFTLLSLGYVKPPQFCLFNHDEGFLNNNTCPSLSFPRHAPVFFSHAGVEVYTHSTLQRGSGGRARHLQEHDSSHNESPVKALRLTRGGSISLPSSPLLPRQVDMAPSQSCIRFPGGFHLQKAHGDIRTKRGFQYEQRRIRRSCAPGSGSKIKKIAERFHGVCFD